MAQILAVSTVVDRPGSCGVQAAAAEGRELKSSMRFSRSGGSGEEVRVTDNEISGAVFGTQCGVPGGMYHRLPGV